MVDMSVSTIWSPAEIGASPDKARQSIGRAAIASAGEAAPARHVALLIDPARLCRFHVELIARLRGEGVSRVTLITGSAKTPAPPASIELLLRLERLVYRIAGLRLTDPVTVEALECSEGDGADAPDLIIDLCGDGGAPVGKRTLRLLFDGVAGDGFLLGALLSHRMPSIEVAEAASGRVVARGFSATDNADGILEKFNFVLARAISLISAVALGRQPLAPPGDATAREAAARQILSLHSTLAHGVARRLYKLCCYAPHWRILWRRLDGPDLWDTRTLRGTSWNIIPDPGYRCYADPFPFEHEGKTWIFVEEVEHGVEKARISVIPLDESGAVGIAQPVLEQPWHLSYPFVFAHAGQIWMIPESSANRTVDLYRAARFPDRWVREATLLAGVEASDATLVRHRGSFWIFAATRDGAGSCSDTLSLYQAPDLLGPWSPHPANPVLIDQASARPAGAMFARNGKLWRPVQDCTRGYGTGIGLAEITALDQEHFEQRVHAVLRADRGWPGRRLHTLNRAGRIECIDGAAHSPRSRRAARLLETWSGRRELKLADGAAPPQRAR